MRRLQPSNLLLSPKLHAPALICSRSRCYVHSAFAAVMADELTQGTILRSMRRHVTSFGLREGVTQSVGDPNSRITAACERIKRPKRPSCRVWRTWQGTQLD